MCKYFSILKKCLRWNLWLRESQIQKKPCCFRTNLQKFISFSKVQYFRPWQSSYFQKSLIATKYLNRNNTEHTAIFQDLGGKSTLFLWWRKKDQRLFAKTRFDTTDSNYLTHFQTQSKKKGMTKMRIGKDFFAHPQFHFLSISAWRDLHWCGSNMLEMRSSLLIAWPTKHQGDSLKQQSS